MIFLIVKTSDEIWLAIARGISPNVSTFLSTEHIEFYELRKNKTNMKLLHFNFSVKRKAI